MFKKTPVCNVCRKDILASGKALNPNRDPPAPASPSALLLSQTLEKEIELPSHGARVVLLVSAVAYTSGNSVTDADFEDLHVCHNCILQAINVLQTIPAAIPPEDVC